MRKEEMAKAKKTEWHLVVLVTYVNINTPAYLKCSLVIVLVILSNGLVKDRISYALHNPQEIMIM